MVNNKDMLKASGKAPSSSSSNFQSRYACAWKTNMLKDM